MTPPHTHDFRDGHCTYPGCVVTPPTDAWGKPLPDEARAGEPRRGQARRVAFLAITDAIARKRSIEASEVSRWLDAIEREAAGSTHAPALDVERLREAIRNTFRDPAWDTPDHWVNAIAAEYARLSEKER